MAKVLVLQMPGSHLGASSYAGCSTSDPAAYLSYDGPSPWDSALGPLHPHGTPGRIAWLLDLGQLESGHCGHFRINQQTEDSVLPSHYNSNKSSKKINFQARCVA